MATPTDQPTEQQDRLRVLVEAGIALASELSLDALLQRIVETAAELTDARYAALGVVHPSGRGLERFLTTGIDAKTYAAIGEIPQGRGILGVVMRETKPLRLHDIADDPRSVGLPPNHPPMHTFLGAPILLRGVAFGNLYLSEKRDGGDFTEDDEDLIQLLAAQAAVAIENARLYESSTRWLRQLESLNEIGNALAAQLELEPLLAMVATRLRELVSARLVLIALPDTEDALRVAAADGDIASTQVGTRLELHGSKVGRVLERGRSERVDSVLDDAEVDQRTARELGITTALYVPLIVHGEAIGVVAAHDKLGDDGHFDDDDLRLSESLAARAAIAVDLSERVTRDGMRKVVEAQELERKRLARELHDETGQALTSILLGLKSLEQALDSDEGREGVASLRDLVVATLQDVRRLAVELRPSALDDFGLAPALERLVDTYGRQAAVPVHLEITLGDDRLPAEVETTLYRMVQEALTNVAKHADATSISILLTRTASSVRLVVEDDGAGFEPGGARDGGLGLPGMRERVALLDGRLRVESAHGKGTTLVAEVPIR
ncbi:MAG TPA: GAF domain-containing sensor histidine kinase [Gaiellaceae bacterium]|nr:GAF domain-containing sensor histidine kinase [Gaiellaceae bacterium]